MHQPLPCHFEHNPRVTCSAGSSRAMEVAGVVEHRNTIRVRMRGATHSLEGLLRPRETARIARNRERAIGVPGPETSLIVAGDDKREQSRRVGGNHHPP